MMYIDETFVFYIIYMDIYCSSTSSPQGRKTGRFGIHYVAGYCCQTNVSKALRQTFFFFKMSFGDYYGPGISAAERESPNYHPLAIFGFLRKYVFNSSFVILASSKVQIFPKARI
jgi:hypothetical protein